jgi:hypothetical protein
MECDNIKKCHRPEIIGEDHTAMRVICKECWHQYVVPKDWRGAPENRFYSKTYKRDILQGHENLFYKYYPQFIKN